MYLCSSYSGTAIEYRTRTACHFSQRVMGCETREALIDVKEQLSEHALPRQKVNWTRPHFTASLKLWERYDVELLLREELRTSAASARNRRYGVPVPGLPFPSQHTQTHRRVICILIARGMALFCRQICFVYCAMTYRRALKAEDLPQCDKRILSASQCSECYAIVMKSKRRMKCVKLRNF
jgi:hypothetical protein